MEQELQRELTALQEKWLARLRACQASGLSVKAFNEREGIDGKRLYTWRKTLTKKGLLSPGQRVQFQRAVINRSAETNCACQVQLPNGVAISFRGNVEPGLLTRVLKTAATL